MNWGPLKSADPSNGLVQPPLGMPMIAGYGDRQSDHLQWTSSDPRVFWTPFRQIPAYCPILDIVALYVFPGNWLEGAKQRPLTVRSQHTCPAGRAGRGLKAPFQRLFLKTRKSCILLQNRLPLLYCSTINRSLLLLYCCFWKSFYCFFEAFTASKMLLLYCCFWKSFYCFFEAFTVSKMLLLHCCFWKSFYCF